MRSYARAARCACAIYVYDARHDHDDDMITRPEVHAALPRRSLMRAAADADAFVELPQRCRFDAAPRHMRETIRHYLRYCLLAAYFDVCSTFRAMLRD